MSMIEILGCSLDEDALMKGVKLCARRTNEIGDVFFNDLFERYAEIKDLFDENKLESQKEYLADVLQKLHENINDQERLEEHLELIANQSKKYELTQEQYVESVEVLASACKKVIGKRWTKAINAAWMKYMSAVVNYIVAVHEPDNTLLGQTDVGSCEYAGSGSAPVSVIKLHVVQDIRKSQALKSEMLSIVNDADEIDIDASEVERIDGTALQLLCALFVYAKANSIVINWVNPADSLLDAARTIGLQNLLELE